MPCLHEFYKPEVKDPEIGQTSSKCAFEKLDQLRIILTEKQETFRNAKDDEKVTLQAEIDGLQTDLQYLKAQVEQAQAEHSSNPAPAKVSGGDQITGGWDTVDMQVSALQDCGADGASVPALTLAGAITVGASAGNDAASPCQNTLLFGVQEPLTKYTTYEKSVMTQEEQPILADILEHSGLGHLCDKIVREEEFDLEGFAMLDPMDTEDLKELGVSYEDLPKFLRVLQAVKETLPWI